MFRNDQPTKKEWTAVIIGVLGLVLTGGSILATANQKLNLCSFVSYACLIS